MIIPVDSRPRILRGWRLATTATFRPTSDSGAKNLAMPASTWRVSNLRSRTGRSRLSVPGAGPPEAPDRRHDPARLDVLYRREHLPGTGVVDGKDEIVGDLGVHEPGQGLGILGYRVPAAHADGLYRPRMPVVGHQGMIADSG